MNMFLRELKANRKALIIWSICMVVFVLSGMSKYTAYSVGGVSSEVFNKMPDTIKALLGFGSFDVTIMSGFFAFLFLYIELTVAIHAVLLGSGIIAKEERDKTTEFLMVKPVSRATVITSKLLSALVNIAVINIVSLFSLIVMVAAYNRGKDITAEIVMFHISMFIVQLIFLSIGTALAAFIRNPKASASLSVGLLLASFMISKITDLYDKLNVLNLLVPFKYFSYKDMVEGNGLDFLAVTLSLLLATVFFVSTYFFYRKRDLSV
jgi:ABC-2 type transport system permease protein